MEQCPAGSRRLVVDFFSSSKVTIAHAVSSDFRQVSQREVANVYLNVLCKEALATMNISVKLLSRGAECGGRVTSRTFVYPSWARIIAALASFSAIALFKQEESVKNVSSPSSAEIYLKDCVICLCGLTLAAFFK